MKTKVMASIGIGALALSLGQSTVDAQEKGTVTATALNVRSGPGLNHNVKGYLYKGNTVSILEKDDGWYKIQLPNGTSGWVSASYVKETTEKVSLSSVENVTETEVNINGKVTCSVNLNVRSGPGTSYAVKSSLKPGQVLFLLTKSSNGWYKINMSNGTTGWVSSSYISETNTYGKTTTNLNVRSGAGTNYSIKTVLKKGEVVTITKSSNSWYEIKTSSNITGWVSSKYITITSESSSSNTNSSANSSTSNNTNANEKTEAVIKLAMAQLGKPYVWGGNGPNSFDCSGFTRYVYVNATGISLPRVSYEQAKSGKAVSTSDLKKGDLLYFATVTPGRTSHVGIYIGDNQFIHASGSQTNPDKVKINSLSGYYGKVLLGARRLY